MPRKEAAIVPIERDVDKVLRHISPALLHDRKIGYEIFKRNF